VIEAHTHVSPKRSHKLADSMPVQSRHTALYDFPHHNRTCNSLRTYGSHPDCPSWFKRLLPVPHPARLTVACQVCDCCLTQKLRRSHSRPCSNLAAMLPKASEKELGVVSNHIRFRAMNPIGSTMPYPTLRKNPERLETQADTATTNRSCSQQTSGLRGL
jgi:hypothetical protein